MKILLVDDEPDILILYSKLLEMNGYEVIIENTGNEAVRRISEDPSIDIILLDFMLGDINGDEVVSQIREFNSRVNIIIHTGCFEFDQSNSISSMVQGFVNKVDDFDKVLEVLRRLI